jgi:hypothetical protein
MGRGRTFSPIEVDILKENYDKTIAELEEILAKAGYIRSRKSINRKLEKLRDSGLVGFRSKDTIKRSYRQRNRRNKRLEPTKIEEKTSWDSGEGSYDSGVDWDNAG